MSASLPADIVINGPVPFAKGVAFEARLGDTLVGVLRLPGNSTTYELFELFVNEAYQGQHVGKAMYRAALRTAIAEGKKIQSGVYRSAAAEGICRRLASLGRARPVHDKRGGKVVTIELAPEQVLELPQPELDAYGKPYWPVSHWLLDPDTKDVDQLDEDSPI